MRTVADERGDRFLLVDQSPDGWVVRDPATGDTQTRPAAELTVVEGASPLATVARTVPESVRQEVDLPGERPVGLLSEIHARGPISVRALLAYDLCESDLHGLLAEFTAAGLLEETGVGFERGYETTATAARLLDSDGQPSLDVD